ncbi:MAG: type II secretion system GspH family protein [Armatimonadetes bacterium]|nr:type II secretion system GspH family protein [Armatimonadota bacterium]MDW8028408.1 type II secretion system protein [Armatimonadota bacterium]
MTRSQIPKLARRIEAGIREQETENRELKLYKFASLKAYINTPLQGFTLTELLTVIAIIAILMGLIVAFYGPSQEQRKVFECQNRLQVIHRALRLYMLDWDGFPASPYDSLDNDRDGRFDEDPPDEDNDNDGQVDEDPVNGRDDDGDGRVDEDPPIDNDGDKRFNEDGIDAQVGGLLALDQYLRSRRTLICPSDYRTLGNIPEFYSSYQGCDTGTDFFSPSFPITSSQQGICFQAGGVPTYAITRFLPGDPCHPSSPLFMTNRCTDPDKMRQLGVLNTKPLAPNPSIPDDTTVVTWCVHHRYVPRTTTPNYVKGGVPADLVLYWDGQVRIQMMVTPGQAWRRKPTSP